MVCCRYSYYVQHFKHHAVVQSQAQVEVHRSIRSLIRVYHDSRFDKLKDLVIGTSPQRLLGP